MSRSLLVTAVLSMLLITGSLLSSKSASAQCSFAPGTPIQLVGTPHLFIVDDQGVLHWGGDTRSLAGRVINWADQCAVNLSQLTAAPRGDPWLSSGLPKIGDPIYLSKWEDTEAAPTLLHIQSIADVELFGINTANYGNFILERGPWEQRFGFSVASLRLGPLASAASFAWPEADRASYGRLLENVENAETAAFFEATSLGTNPAAVLPGIADCERLGLDLFESGRNAGIAFQRIQACLGALGFDGVAPAPQPLAAPPSVPTAPFNLRAAVLG
ncbi:MAG: hypothetical protein HW416_2745, partial [Chloroflexi bacterium]|nr:hypothetical protein [Chloroflexota bacterium]